MLSVFFFLFLLNDMLQLLIGNCDEHPMSTTTYVSLTIARLSYNRTIKLQSHTYVTLVRVFSDVLVAFLYFDICH